jgi:hypothetical protein
MNRDTLIQQARNAAQAIRERTAPWRQLAEAKLAEHEESVAKVREWSRTFALDRRPVKVVATAVVVGALYAVIWDPFAQSGPHAPAVVAERVAPVGTVTLGPVTGSRVAEQTGPSRLPAGSVN